MPKSHIEFFESAVEKDPDDSFVRYALAMEYRKSDRLDDALATFEVLIERDPEYVAAYQMAAEVAVALQQIERARDIIARGTEAARKVRNLHAASKMTELLDSL